MKVFHAKFQGHWIGGYAVIVARGEKEARARLDEELEEHGLLKGERPPAEIVEIATDKVSVHVLSNGEY
jgi:hypothetical protein